MSEFNKSVDLQSEMFINFALTLLFKGGWVTKSASNADPEGTRETALEFIREFFYEFEGQFSTEQEAKDKFQRWLERRPQVVPELMNISVTRTFNIGGGETVSFSYGGKFECSTMGDRRAASSWLLGQVMGSYEHWIRSHSFRETAQRSSADNQNVTSGEQKIEITAVSKETKDGQVRYSLKGGQYQKFGVPLYKEVIRDCHEPADFASLDYGNTPARGTMSVYIENGKAKRVTWFELEFRQ